MELKIITRRFIQVLDEGIHFCYFLAGESKTDDGSCHDCILWTDKIYDCQYNVELNEVVLDVSACGVTGRDNEYAIKLILHEKNDLNLFLSSYIVSHKNEGYEAY